MRFTGMSLPDVYLIEPEWRRDERGFFGRTWCEREFREHGIAMTIRQCNLSGNRAHGTLRGMHFQASPHAEAKVVSCLRGAIHDVILDLRPDSPSFKRYAAIELSAENGRMVYMPSGMAHGYQTLTDDTLVYYQMSEYYVPEAQRGVRWDDPAFAIEWPPVEARIISARDRAFGDFLG